MKRERNGRDPTMSVGRRHRLLARVLEIYRGTPVAGREAAAFLTARGIRPERIPAHQRPGYSDGRLAALLPEQGGSRSELIALGLLSPEGEEFFRGCLVLPLSDCAGALLSLAGIHAETLQTVCLGSSTPGVWNLQAASRHRALIVAQAPLDALSLYTAGLANAICPCGCTDHSPWVEALAADTSLPLAELVFLACPGDPPEPPAGPTQRGTAGSVRCRRVLFDPMRSPLDVLRERGADALAEQVASRLRACDRDAESNSEAASPVRPGAGPVLVSGSMRYTVPGLERTACRLKATIRAEQSGRLHVDTLDLYNARLRRTLCQDLCRVFDLPADRATADIANLIGVCEAHGSHGADVSAADGGATAATPEELAEAEAFGRSLDLFERVLADYETCGLIGEEHNKLLCYLAAVSRKMPDPLAVLILSSSGAGKTALQDATLRLCPPEDVVKLTNLTGKALFYKDELSLKHKVLAIEEGEGAAEASYAIRNLISAGELTTETTVRDAGTGRLTTQGHRVEGPCAVFETTTDPDIDAETRSRFLVTHVDESAEQTRAILEFQRRRRTLAGSRESGEVARTVRRHRVFQRLLRPLCVVNPFGPFLGYGDDRLQGRRDQPKYLNLIDAVAFLRQLPKPIRTDSGGAEYVEVDETDLRLAHDLAHVILGRSLDEVSYPARQLYRFLDDLVDSRIRAAAEAREDGQGLPRPQIRFSRRDIMEFTGWNKVRVHRYLRELVDIEYVAVEGRRCPLHYRLLSEARHSGTAGRYVPGLRSVEQILADHSAGSCCPPVTPSYTRFHPGYTAVTPEEQAGRIRC